MFKWYRKPPIENADMQIDWNQTLMTTINQAVKAVQDKKSQTIGKGRMFVTQVEPQLSCPENMREVIESLPFYDKEQGFIRGIETHDLIRRNIYVDFRNESTDTISYRHDHTIIIELIDENFPE